MCPVTRLYSVCGYSVTYSEHNRLAINPIFNIILHSETQEFLHIANDVSVTILFYDKQWQEDLMSNALFDI